MVFKSPGGGRKWPQEKSIRWTLQHRPSMRQLEAWLKVDCCGGIRRYNVTDWSVIAGVFYSATEQMDGDEELATMTIAKREKWQATWIRTMVGIVYAIATNSYFMLANSNEQASISVETNIMENPEYTGIAPFRQDKRNLCREIWRLMQDVGRCYSRVAANDVQTLSTIRKMKRASTSKRKRRFDQTQKSCDSFRDNREMETSSDEMDNLSDQDKSSTSDSSSSDEKDASDRWGHIVPRPNMVGTSPSGHPDRKPCIHHLQFRCKWGSTCQLWHPGECVSWANKAQCLYGKYCLFRHNETIQQVKHNGERKAHRS